MGAAILGALRVTGQVIRKAATTTAKVAVKAGKQVGKVAIKAGKQVGKTVLKVGKSIAVQGGKQLVKITKNAGKFTVKGISSLATGTTNTATSVQLATKTSTANAGTPNIFKSRNLYKMATAYVPGVFAYNQMKQTTNNKVYNQIPTMQQMNSTQFIPHKSTTNTQLLQIGNYTVLASQVSLSKLSLRINGFLLPRQYYNNYILYPDTIAYTFNQTFEEVTLDADNSNFYFRCSSVQEYLNYNQVSIYEQGQIVPLFSYLIVNANVSYAGEPVNFFILSQEPLSDNINYLNDIIEQALTLTENESNY